MAKFSKAHKLALSKAALKRHAKKRGVKPKTKRGPYKPNKTTVSALMEIETDSLTLYEQLDAALTQLENRILNTVTRIKSLGI